MTRLVDMEIERNEKLDEPLIEWPISYTLFDGGANGVLSEAVTDNREFQLASAERRNTYQLLSDVLLKLEDGKFDVNEALKLRIITESDISRIYKYLGEFIDRDKNNARLLLYLPFELFPIDQDEINRFDDLKSSQHKFYGIIGDAWEELLYESDVRASFVDGDVLELGMGEPVRVRKAAHLIPFLVPAGVLQIEDVNQILEQAKKNNEDELIASIEDGLLALTNLGFEKEPISVLRAKDSLYVKLSDLERELSEDSDYVKSVSRKRVVWEKKVKREEILEGAARDFSDLLLLQEFDIDEIGGLDLTETDKSTLVLKTLQFSIEKSFEQNGTVNNSSVDRLKVLCKELWQGGSDLLKDEVYCSLSRLNRLGLITDVGKDFGVEIYDLASVTPVYFENLVKREYESLIELSKVIKSDRSLSDSLFPFFACIGSQTKGIAGRSSDKDAVMFWRPGVTPEKRTTILKKVAEICPKILEMDSMPEVWLEKVGEKFTFRTGTESFPNNVTPQQIHFILNGLLVGEKNEIKQVMSDLVEGYLDLSRLGEDKDKARQFLLRRLEMDNLMYRLMHKGYKRSYLQKNDKGIMQEIDYKSDFYEPGYRRIASLIFISRVFLPDIVLDAKKAPN